MKIKKTQNKNKAFTLAEMMVALAITIVLLSLGGVSVAQLKDNLNQTKADSIARQIYVSSQENITRVIAAGNSSDLTKTSLGAKELDSQYYPLKGYEGESLYYTLSSDELAQYFIPDGTFDNGEEDNTYIIEYDPTTGLIVGVFYNELDKNAANNHSFYKTSDTNNLRKSVSNRKSYSKQYFNNVAIGYYGAGQSDETAKGRDKFDLETSVIIRNNDNLTVTYNIDPGKYSAYIIETYVTYAGETSGATKTATYRFEKGGPYTTTVTLDSLLDESLAFEKQFTGFIKGEEILITAESKALNTGTKEIKSAAVVKSVNSYFADAELNNDNTMTAYISFTRHLRNLNKVSTANDAPLKFSKAKQNRDIVVPVYRFTPITNNKLLTYDGDGYSIQNLIVYSTDKEENPTKTYTNLGLFGTFGNNSCSSSNYAYIQNLSLINTSVDGVGVNTGLLAGEVLPYTKIINCGGYITENFVGKTEAPADHVKAVGEYIGGLVGYTRHDVQITNSFASTITSAALVNGGLVGRTDSNLTITTSYCDSYMSGATMGGLIGKGDNFTINSSYAAGIPFNTDICMHAAGLAFGKATMLNKCYTIFDANCGRTSKYSTVTSATKANCAYYIDIMEERCSKASGTSKISDSELQDKNTILKSSYLDIISFEISDNKSHPYNFNGLDLQDYPYPTIKGIDHYGDWLVDDATLKDCGLIYWEKEVVNGSASYHYYVVYDDDSDQSKIDNNICSTHNTCGGVITEYGYGVMIKTTKFDANTSIDWDSNSVPTYKKSGSSVNSLDCNINEAATAAMQKQLGHNGAYYIECYKTADSSSTDCSKTGDLYLKSIINFNIATAEEKEFNLLRTTHTTVTLHPRGTSTWYSYSFCPFFAYDIVVEISNSFSFVADILSDFIRYKSVFLSYDCKPHYIRSIDQLQFINYNYDTHSCHTYVDNGNFFKYPFLRSFSLLSAGGINFDASRYKQTHDIDATNYTGFTPIAATKLMMHSSNIIRFSDVDNWLNLNEGLSYRPTLFLNAWFGGEYNGNSYQIRNLNISSDSTAVGLFGVTVGARLNNIIMTSDNGSVIKRVDSNKENYTDYFVGGVAGFAGDATGDVVLRLIGEIDTSASKLNASITNCAIGGYVIQDRSDNPTTLTGGASVGGLIGASSVQISNCEAVVDIEVYNQSEYGSVFVGGLVGDECGGIYPVVTAIESLANPNSDLKSVSIYNCYTGGSISFKNNSDKISVFTDSQLSNLANLIKGGSKFKGYYVGGIAGTNKELNVSNIVNFSSWTRSISIFDCYSYMKLPESKSGDNIYTIGKIFAFNVNPLWSDIYKSGIAGLSFNLLYDCNYYGGSKIGNTDNFIEKEAYLTAITAVTALNNKVICLYDKNQKGIRDCTYSDLVALSSGVTNFTFNCTSKLPVVYKYGDANLNCYPFKSVVTRIDTGETVHVGKWPSATRISLGRTSIGGTKSYVYIANNEKVKDLEAYIANVFKPNTYYNNGFYIGSEKIINANGTFAVNKGYYDGSGDSRTWKYAPTSTCAINYIDTEADMYRRVVIHSPYLSDGSKTKEIKLKAGETITSLGSISVSRSKTADIESFEFTGWYQLAETTPTFNTSNQLVKELVFNENGTADIYAGWRVKYGKVFIQIEPSDGLQNGKEYVIFGTMPTVDANGKGVYVETMLSIGQKKTYKYAGKEYYYYEVSPKPVKWSTTIGNKNQAIIYVSAADIGTPFVYSTANNKKMFTYGSYGNLAYKYMGTGNGYILCIGPDGNGWDTRGVNSYDGITYQANHEINLQAGDYLRFYYTTFDKDNNFTLGSSTKADKVYILEGREGIVVEAYDYE